MTKTQKIALTAAAGVAGAAVLTVSVVAFLISKAFDEAFEDTYYL